MELENENASPKTIACSLKGGLDSTHEPTIFDPEMLEDISSFQLLQEDLKESYEPNQFLNQYEPSENHIFEPEPEDIKLSLFGNIDYPAPFNWIEESPRNTFF